MKPAKEYSILPQCERDNGYIIRPEHDPIKRKSCVLILFVILAVIVIISGALALVVGLFYSQEFTRTVNTYWNANSSSLSSDNSNSSAHEFSSTVSSKNPILQNDTVTITNVPPELVIPTPISVASNSNGGESSKKNETVLGNGEEEITSPPQPPTDEALKKNGGNTDGSTEAVAGNEEDEDEEDSEEDDNNSGSVENDDVKVPVPTPTTLATTTTTTAPPTTTEHPRKKPIKHKHNSTKLVDREEEFAETMQQFEKYVESVTGIRRAEFVIPILMLLVFVVALALASCCCYCLLKRKEHRRRKVLGKMITDLQAGDKSGLLDQDGDE